MRSMAIAAFLGLSTCLGFAASTARAEEPVIVQESATGIKHSLLATGGETYILGEDGKIAWTYPSGSRDGWVLPSGNILLAVNKGSEGFPNGGAVETTRDGKTVFKYVGTQSEVDTVQALENGKYLVTESGPKPRLMEVDKDGKITLEFPFTCQTNDFHMQTRMARKLPNGNYLVPHLIDKAVREYTPEGKVIWEAKCPNWPFTAIRLDNGNTLINCTVGNEVIEVDKDAKIIWHLTNADLGAELIKDACGGQRLPNGNTVITSYRTGPNEVRMFEVTPEKKVVWTMKSDKPHGVHHFQILTTNDKPVEGKPLK